MTSESGAMAIAPMFESDAAVLYRANCLEVLPCFHDKSIDSVITDPPFSAYVHSNTRTNKSTNGAQGGREIGIDFDHLTTAVRARLAGEFSRLVSRWALVFGDVESGHEWRLHSAMQMEYIRTGLWIKSNPMPQITGDRPGMGYEAISIFHALNPKGKPGRKRWNGGGRAGVWKYPVPKKRTGRVHPTEKPWRLLAELVAQFTDEGDTILDPFAGSGSLAVAAKHVGKRRVVLVETKGRYCAEIVSRLGGAVPARNGQEGFSW